MKNNNRAECITETANHFFHFGLAFGVIPATLRPPVIAEWGIRRFIKGERRVRKEQLKDVLKAPGITIAEVASVERHFVETLGH